MHLQFIRLFCLLLLACLLVACAPSPSLPLNATAPTTTTPQSPLADSLYTTTEEHTKMPNDESTSPAWVLNTTNKNTYETLPSGVVERTLTIRTHLGGSPIRISHMTDTHIIYYNEQDLADPVLKASYDALNGPSTNGWPLSNVAATVAEANQNTDLVVVTGDVIARYSTGALEKFNTYIVSKCDGVLATLGNHDTERITGNVGDPLTEEERRALVAKGWCNDITYTSRVLGEKAMVIAMDNGHGFREEQIPRLEADLEHAREEGYVVLLFFHVPLNTGRTEDNNIPPDWGNHEHWSFGTASGCVGPDSRGTDGRIYSMIRRNGDLIRGIFCGHVHGDFYVEIPATTAEGEATIIPQYVISPVYADKGHYLRINVE